MVTWRLEKPTWADIGIASNLEPVTLGSYRNAWVDIGIPAIGIPANLEAGQAYLARHTNSWAATEILAQP